MSHTKNYSVPRVKAPAEYPGKVNVEGYIKLSHLIWWQYTGVAPEPGEVIHHINGDEKDNRFENLQKMTISEHMTLHHTRYPSEDTDKMITLTCTHCGATIVRRAARWRYSQRQGQTDPFCGPSCYNQYMYPKD